MLNENIKPSSLNYDGLILLEVFIIIGWLEQVL